MRGQKLNYVFHNPNSMEETLKHILKTFIFANEKKLNEALKIAEENNQVLHKIDEIEISI